MVAASSLHERQNHDLDMLRVENNTLKSKVDGLYGDAGSRTVGGKSKAESELSREDVEPVVSEDMWNDFAKQIGNTF
jgi:hypothetical protein